MFDIILEVAAGFRVVKELATLPGAIWRGFHYEKYYGKDK